uniref:U4/U6 small nuclear ribonucleoprotein Prp3, putative n=1 Tax=Arundo donax TaxID=35708 RepID=A0A0A9FB61_ARUDO
MKMRELVLDLMRLLENLVQMEVQPQLLAKVVTYLLML